MKKDMQTKHEISKQEMVKVHDLALKKLKDDFAKREAELNKEIDKYLESNEDLFTQNEQLNEEMDELRNQQIKMLNDASPKR